MSAPMSVSSVFSDIDVGIADEESVRITINELHRFYRFFRFLNILGIPILEQSDTQPQPNAEIPPSSIDLHKTSDPESATPFYVQPNDDRFSRSPKLAFLFQLYSVFFLCLISVSAVYLVAYSPLPSLTLAFVIISLLVIVSWISLYWYFSQGIYLKTCSLILIDLTSYDISVVKPLITSCIKTSILAIFISAVFSIAYPIFAFSLNDPIFVVAFFVIFFIPWLFMIPFISLCKFHVAHAQWFQSAAQFPDRHLSGIAAIHNTSFSTVAIVTMHYRVSHMLSVTEQFWAKMLTAIVGTFFFSFVGILVSEITIYTIPLILYLSVSPFFFLFWPSTITESHSESFKMIQFVHSIGLSKGRIIYEQESMIRVLSNRRFSNSSPTVADTSNTSISPVTSPRNVSPGVPVSVSSPIEPNLSNLPPRRSLSNSSLGKYQRSSLGNLGEVTSPPPKSKKLALRRAREFGSQAPSQKFISPELVDYFRNSNVAFYLGDAPLSYALISKLFYISVSFSLVVFKIRPSVI